MEYLQQTWVVVAAAIGGISLVWNFIHKTFNEIKDEVKRPFKDLEAKIDNIESKLDVASAHDAQVQRALLTMQRNSLLRSCENFIKNGCASLEEKQTISEQYTSYSELGGDQFISDMVAIVMNLPLEKPSAKQAKKDKTKKSTNSTK